MHIQQERAITMDYKPLKRFTNTWGDIEKFKEDLEQQTLEDEISK